MGKRCAAAVSTVAVTLVLMGTTPPSGELRGDLSRAAGAPDCAPCLREVVASVKSLERHGEVLGFRWDPVHPRPGRLGRHWQGIQRLFVPGQGLDGRLFVVSSSHPDLARLAVVRMDSRGGSGGALGSNRLSTATASWNTPPPPQDRIVSSMVVSDDHRHPGGVHAVGAYVLVPLEKSNGDRREGAVACLRFTGGTAKKMWEMDAPTEGAAAAAAVRLDAGGYLMVVGGKGPKRLDFYLSRRETLDEPEWEHLATWHAAEARSVLGGSDVQPHRIWDRYQALTLVTECGTGDLYLLGYSGPILPGLGIVDWIDAFRLRVSPAGIVDVVKVAQRTVYGRQASGGRQSHFRAAAGAYIDPHHRLLVYATEHGVGGPQGSVKMMEWGPSPTPVGFP